jgi:hypothetical protein
MSSLVKFCNTVAANVLALGEEADFVALNCLPALHLIRSTKLYLSTEPAFLPNACYVLCFYFFPLLCRPVLNIFNAVSCCLLVSLLVAIDKAK